MTFLRIAALVFAVGAASPVGAQSTQPGMPTQIAGVGENDNCDADRASIVTLADRIIAERDLAEGFSGAQFGTLAVYLKLRVQGLGLDEGLALIELAGRSGRRPPRGLDELKKIFAISQLGVSKGLSVDGESELAAFAQPGLFLPRQIILADGGISFLRLLADVRADPALAPGFEAHFIHGIGIPRMLVDQSDRFKLGFALRAEAAGETVLAGLMLGSRSDLSEYYAFLDRNKDANLVLVGPPSLDSQLMTAQFQTAPQPRGDTPDAMARANRAQNFDISRASYRMGGIAWLLILYNQTGLTEPIAAASRDFLAAIEAGEVNPDKDIEAAWLYLRQALAQRMGAEELARGLNLFDLGTQLRHYAGRANTVLDWMEAIAALADYAAGAQETAPMRSALLAEDFDWASWLRVAAVLRHGEVNDLLEGEDRKIGIELLFAAGDMDAALDLAAGVVPNRDRLSIYRDLMQRLDRRCDGFTIFPGYAVTMGGIPVYWFEQVGG